MGFASLKVKVDQLTVHNYSKKKTVDEGWQVVDGAIKRTKKAGDLVTDKEYADFELKLEWKISPCGNSGIMYNVVESPDYDYVWQTGPEMQVLDNVCHPDAKIETHRAGDLYDLIACRYVTVNPAGCWISAAEGGTF